MASNYTVKSGDTLSRIAQQNGMTLAQLIAQNPQFASNPNAIRPGQTVTLGGAGGGNTSVDSSYHAAIDAHPKNPGGSSASDLANAYATGDWSNIKDSNGQPFSTDVQTKATNDAIAAYAPAFQADLAKSTTDTQNSLAGKQAEYQNFLNTSAQNFQQDKSTLDQNAANQGVLFSGARVQKEQNLKNTYLNDQAYKQGIMSRDISNTANDFQYKYGNNAANGLSQYYNLGSNSYNPNVATGGATSNGLSAVYNPNNYNYQGTQNTANGSQIQQRAAGYLWNQGNKILPTSVNNKYN